MIQQLVDTLTQFGEHVFPLLGQQLLFTLWVFIAVAFVSQLTKKWSSQWHMALWSMVLVRLFLPVNFALPFSLRQLAEQLNLFAFLRQPVPVQTVAEPLVYIPNIPMGVDIMPTQNPIPTLETVHQSLTVGWMPIVLLAWVIGVITVGMIYIHKTIRYKRVIRHASVVNEPDMTALLTRLQKTLNIKRSIKLVTSIDSLSPFTMGLVKPVVFIPNDILEQSDKHVLESILAHELVHVKRFDGAWIKTQNFVNTLFFFFPIVWLVNKRINFLRECLCDSTVLSTCNIPRKIYGHSLIDVLRLNLMGSRSFDVLPTFGFPKPSLKDRINNLRGDIKMTVKHKILYIVMFFVCAALLLPMATQAVQQNVTDSDKSHYTAQDGFRLAPIVDGGMITAKYGPMPDPFKSDKEYNHKGVDIKAQRGSKIFATADGIVDSVLVDYVINKGYGRFVIIDHQNGFKTIYAHCQAIKVSKGDEVKKGDIIATVGTTGKSTGPHIHFELRYMGTCINPFEKTDQADVPFIITRASDLIGISMGKVTDKGKVTAVFGPRMDPFVERIKDHYGVDIAAPKGDNVYAIEDGIVEDIVNENSKKNYGNFILVAHKNNFKTKYGLLGSVLVEKGQNVKKGDVIGRMGLSGRTKGPHVHLELYKDGDRVNPLDYTYGKMLTGEWVPQKILK